MKNYLYLVVLCAALSSCGGNEDAQDNNHTESTENTATEQDLKVVEETQAVKIKAEKATDKADSILNSL